MSDVVSSVKSSYRKFLKEDGGKDAMAYLSNMESELIFKARKESDPLKIAILVRQSETVATIRQYFEELSQ